MASPAQYAVLQKDGLAPNPDQIRRAFRAFSNLTDADAVRLAANAQGILLRRLDADSARAFHQALLKEGVAAALVPESTLGLLPETKSLHRLEITPGALMVFDLHGQSEPVAWTEVSLIAAGAVRRMELIRTEPDRTLLRFNSGSGTWPNRASEAGRAADFESQLLLELVVTGGAARYEINAAQFPFKYAIDRPDLSTLQKFVWLVKEICRHAPGALLNRGARDLSEGFELVRGYLDRQVFTDEKVWLLWNDAQKKRAGALGGR